MTYQDLLLALRHRWRLVLSSWIAVLLLVAGWTLVSPRQYEASARLLFDFANHEPVDGDQGKNEPQAALLGTQADILRSIEVASQVVAAEGFDSDPVLRARWAEQSGGKGDFNSWLGAGLLKDLRVTPAKNSNVLAVSFTSRDPAFAAAVANGFTEAFVRIQLRLRTEPAKVYSDWFAHRIADARAKLERAQARLTAFQQRQGLIGGEKLDVELSHLSDLTSQLALAEAAAADAGARARSGGVASAEVQMSAAVTGLRSAVAAKAAEVEQLGATLGPNHPQMQTAQAALATLRAKLGEAVASATGTLHASQAASASRVGELRTSLTEQRARVLRLSSLQDELQVLQRDVNGAKADYDAVTQSLSSARLRAQIPQTSVTVLDRAEPPLFPVSPDLRLRLLIAFILGGLLGAGLGIAAEWLDPRARSAEGLLRQTGLGTLFVANEGGRHSVAVREAA